MDEETKCARIAAVGVRRAMEHGVKPDEKRRWECGGCGSRHSSYNSHVEHELCEKCRNAAFEKMRETNICCRCETATTTLTPAGVSDGRSGRFLICLRCALIIPRDPEDRVTGSGAEYLPRRTAAAPG